MRLKLTCYTPKGKAEKTSKTAKTMFGLLKQPTETTIVNDSTFYYVYEGELKDLEKIIRKVPKAESIIRKAYTIIIHTIERGNTVGKKYAWSLDKTRAWILNQLRKKKIKERELADMMDSIELTDKDDMMAFLVGKLFDVEILDGPNSYFGDVSGGVV